MLFYHVELFIASGYHSALVSLLFILGLGPVATFFVKKLRKVQAAKMKMASRESLYLPPC